MRPTAGSRNSRFHSRPSALGRIAARPWWQTEFGAAAALVRSLSSIVERVASLRGILARPGIVSASVSPPPTRRLSKSHDPWVRDPDTAILKSRFIALASGEPETGGD